MTRWPSVLAFALLLSCGPKNHDEDESATPRRTGGDGTVHLTDVERKALGLETTTTTVATLPSVTLRTGVVVVRPGDEASLTSAVPVRIAKTPRVALGSSVKAGDVIVELVPVVSLGEAASAGVQSAELEGQAAEAERDVQLRESELARARDLARDAIVSAAQVQQAEASAASARSRLVALRRARQAQAGATVRPIVLKSPIAGTVVALDAPVGAVVEAGHALARVVASGSRWVDVAVPPGEPSAEGYEVSLGHEWLPAHLIVHGSVVGDEGVRRDRLEVEGAAGAALVAGASVSVRLARDPAPGAVLPEAALVPGAGGDAVFVESAPGVFQVRVVRVAARFAGKVRLASGVEPGAQVVTRGAMALRGELMRSQLGEDED